MKKFYGLLLTPVIVGFTLNEAAEYPRLPQAPGGPKEELVYTEQEAKDFIFSQFKNLVRENHDKAIQIWEKANISQVVFELLLRYLSKDDLNLVKRGYRPFGKIIFPDLGTDATKEV